MALSPTDPNSYSRPDLAIVTHTHLNVTADFDKHVLRGHVILDIEEKGKTDELILDIRDINLVSVVNAEDDSELKFNVGESVDYGSKLTIKLPKIHISINDKVKFKVKIEYETSPKATALQWLTAEQTEGGKHPYLFSQCEALHCRSLMPCQDTPFVKSTYTAEIRAPSELTVLMSALRDGVEQVDSSTKVYKFHQPIPIPSYLTAIAIGALISKQVGPRSLVWSEKESIDACAYEFAETDEMLKTAENICGPYVWDKYDLLILPPSFPMGGMENPCLTFITPTVIAGDRSLVNVVAHEIAHSWSGNLVTNANFEHFWLNEGITVFVERKILGRLGGEKTRQFAALEGLQTLEMELKRQKDTPEQTKLVPNLVGVNPDDIFSSIPYEKGHVFLYYLEELLGGPKEFEPFLIEYFKKFQYKSLKTEDFKNYLCSYFKNKSELLNKINWDAWLYSSGEPPVIPNYDKTLLNACTHLADKWCSPDSNSFNEKDIENMSSNQQATFLTDLVLRQNVLSIESLQLMQNLYKFDKSRNCEIRFSWLRLCLKSRWVEKVDDALKFVTEQGRMKYVRPIYQDLYKWEEMRPRAIDNFLKYKNKMMYMTRDAVAKDLHLNV